MCRPFGPNIRGPLPEPLFGSVLSLAFVYFQNKAGGGKREFFRGKMGGSSAVNCIALRGVTGPGSPRRYCLIIVTCRHRRNLRQRWASEASGYHNPEASMRHLLI